MARTRRSYDLQNALEHCLYGSFVQGTYARGVLEGALEVSRRNLRQPEARDELCSGHTALL